MIRQVLDTIPHHAPEAIQLVRVAGDADGIDLPEVQELEITTRPLDDVLQVSGNVAGGVILLDAVADLSILDALPALRAVAPGAPILVLVSANHEDAAVEALEGGGDGYLIAGRLQATDLIRAVKAAVRLRSCMAALEHRLMTFERLDAVCRLAGGIAHKLNNELMVALFNVSALLDQIGTDDPTRGQLDSIRDSTRRSAVLSRKLNKLSTNVASPVTATDLNEAVRTVQPLLECLLRPSVRLNLRLATEDCLTQADAGQIEQLVINLGVNAVDAMPNGGVLTIRTERRTSQRKDADRGEVALTVHDTGDTPGGDHVFAVFHERGDGQWMNAAARTARAIVGRYGGRLEVAPSPGGGTAWSAAFPEVHATSWAF